MSALGALRFGRYAFPPNRLGYCGPDEQASLREYVTSRTFDGGLVELERRFEGAYPYLQLIAGAGGIPDPFDDRVVEAYWVGSPLLERVEPGRLSGSLERLRGRMPAKDFGWLERKAGLGAQPHHNFHVFDVYTRAGLMREGRSAPLLSVMDSCRVSWGRVLSAAPAGPLLVARSPLVLAAGKLALGPEEPRELEGYGDDLAPGDIVSVHWDWACEKLDAGALSRLRRATAHALALANLTV